MGLYYVGGVGGGGGDWLVGVVLVFVLVGFVVFGCYYWGWCVGCEGGLCVL